MWNGNGFTLIKLLIAVVVIGSLAAFAIPTFGNRTEKAVVAGMQSDLHRLVAAQDAFYRDNQTYARAIGPTQGTVTVAFEPTGNNVITLSSVSSAGWAGEVTNSALEGSVTRCGIYIGSGTAPNAAVESEGAPACY